MPVKVHQVKAYDEHQNLINTLHDKKVFCWYVGAKGDNGQSWCGDCRDSAMPLVIHSVNTYNDHINLLNKLRSSMLFCWYAAGKDSDGIIWCPDSREAEPIINDYLKSLKIKNDEEVHMIYTELERDYFKSPDCDFRTDPKIKLEKVPTLFNPKDMKSLVENDCKEKSLLDLFFEDIRQA